MLTSTLVVFDLDGTLIDSRLDLARSTNDMLLTYGASRLPEATVTSFVGEGARTLVARALAAAALPETVLDEAVSRFLEIYGRRLTETTRPYEGIDEVLDDLRSAGAALGVITNKPQAPTDRLLMAFGWTTSFRWVIGGDTAFPRKPDPSSLKWVMGEAGAAPSATLFVGDSPIDAETARKAGACFCFAGYGFGDPQKRWAAAPDSVRVESPSDLRYFLRK